MQNSSAAASVEEHRLLSRRPTIERQTWLQCVENGLNVLEKFMTHEREDRQNADAVKLDHVHRPRLAKVLQLVLSAMHAQAAKLEPSLKPSAPEEDVLKAFARARAFDECTSDEDILELLKKFETNVRLAFDGKLSNPRVMEILRDAFRYMVTEAQNGLTPIASATNTVFSEEHNNDIDGTPLAEDDE